MIAALRPMRAQKPEARFVMLSTANSRTDPFWSAWESGGETWKRIQVTVDQDRTLYTEAYLEQERRALGEDRFKREFLGVPAGGLVSPFGWDLFDGATRAIIDENAWQIFKPSVIVHDVGCTRDRSTAIVGGRTILAPGLSLLKEFNELPRDSSGARVPKRLPRSIAFMAAKVSFSPISPLIPLTRKFCLNGLVQNA